MATGGIAISFANPTDVVKIRMQAQGRLPPAERPYTSSLDCYQKILAKDGITGFWVGWGPNVARNAIINAAELASYDQFKQIALGSLGMSNGLHTHILCAFGAGFNAVVFGSPVDVIKTRLMNKTPGQSLSLIGIVPEILFKEGPLAFYKGFQANFLRLGSWNVCMFVALEQIKNYVDGPGAGGHH
jgi:solute carrier family 25 uncoupling protein 8/9